MPHADVYLELQQLLPFTVLKPSEENFVEAVINALQQLLPFTVLKRHITAVCVYDLEAMLQQLLPFTVLKL